MTRRDPRSPEHAQETLRGMWRIRRFEEGLEELFTRGLLHGTMHLSIGQEGVAEGTCGALQDGDYITSTHRGHGHTLAHGGDPMLMMAELLMKDTGYCRGRGGSMHIADVSGGNLGANGIVAGSMTIAAGAALSQKINATGKIVVCFFGDGAANEGSFHEALNLSGVWDLPVIWLCENNQYGMSMSQDRSTAGGSVAGRAGAYGMPGVTADGNDVVDVFDKVSQAADRARSGEGPTLVEAITYRYRGHSKSDRNLYRTQEEIEDWRSHRDPLVRYEGRVLEEGWLDQAGVDAARQAAKQDIRDAIAEAFRQPDATAHDLEDSAYA